MDKLLDELWKLAVEQLDLLLIVAIVFIVQRLKSVFPKIPKKSWLLVMMALGVLAAWITTPEVVGHGKEFGRQCLIYVAGSEFAYQSWRTITETAREKLAGKAKG